MVAGNWKRNKFSCHFLLFQPEMPYNERNPSLAHCKLPGATRCTRAVGWDSKPTSTSPPSATTAGLQGHQGMPAAGSLPAQLPPPTQTEHGTGTQRVVENTDWKEKIIFQCQLSMHSLIRVFQRPTELHTTRATALSVYFRLNHSIHRACLPVLVPCRMSFSCWLRALLVCFLNKLQRSLCW